MKLQDNEINLILSSFPLLRSELSYEIITHKKVHNPDIILAIPDGKKCFTWFTNYKSENVCFLLELDSKNEIRDVKIVTTCFDDCLSTGTVLYGTLFTYNSINCFCIEDIYYYKNKNYIHVSYLTKLDTLSNILKNEMSQCALNRQYTIFGIPLLNKDFDSLLQEIPKLPYKISQIKHRFFDKNNYRKILTMNYFKPGKQYTANTNNLSKNTITKAIFKITADIEPDIYNLFIYNNGEEEYYGVACIPDYKTSVMMNKLFRKIKENENLDAIEESDNEDEFEDKKEDKFVHLDRSYKFHCEYNHKFNRWCPVNLAGENERIISSNILLRQVKTK
jgi:hypothetical protein